MTIGIDTSDFPEGWEEVVERYYNAGYEEAKDYSYDEGRSDGWDAGYSEGFDDGAAEMKDQLAAVVDHVSEIAGKLKRFENDLYWDVCSSDDDDDGLLRPYLNEIRKLIDECERIAFSFAIA